MRFSLLPVIALLRFVAAAAALDASNTTLLDRDVVIIGGGASGTYAAIRLQQEGKTVALVERESRLGGHVNTYTDPVTGQTVDYGVQIFSNLTVLRDFFHHFDVPLVDLPTSGRVSQSIDLLTGALIPSGSVDESALGAALLGYLAQLEKYPGIANRWDLNYPVPEDLLMEFGDFMEKYNLTAMAYLAFSYNQGIGNILAQPTMYVMKYFDAQLVNDILTGGFVMNGLQNNQLVYDRAQAELGSNAFVSSEVLSVTRSGTGVNVMIRTPQGPELITASKLLLTIPPNLSNLGFLDVNANEMSLFSQFNNSYYWDAVVKNAPIDAAATVSNIDPLAPYGIPAMPGIYGLTATAIVNTKLMYYGSPYALSTDEVNSAFIDALGLVAKVQNISLPNGQPEIVEIHDHSPFELTVSTDAVAAGFYQDLQALQGQRNTWWTGAAWNTHATATLYNFTEYQILPHLLS